MTLIRTFISHANADKTRIEGILRKLSPFGIRPWLDREELMNRVGGSLSKALREGILQDCQSMILFLSENSVMSGWVEDEVETALTKLENGFLILPVYLDAPDAIKISGAFMEALRQRSSTPDTIYVKADDALLYEKITASVFNSYGLNEMEVIVLHLGHRLETLSPQIPQPWCQLPVLDIRLSYPMGCRSYSPTAAEWKEIRNGIATIRRFLPRIKTLRVCGFAPLGVGAIVGDAWDRGTNVRISAWNERKNQEWPGLTPEEERKTSQWSPKACNSVAIQNQMDLGSAGDEIVLAIIAKEEQALRARQWSNSMGKSFVWIRPPEYIGNPEEAKKVLMESIGSIRWMARTYSKINCMDIVTGLPLAMMPLLVQYLKRYGKMRFFDQIYDGTDPSKMYREAATWI
jgi:hypothetical protein